MSSKRGIVLILVLGVLVLLTLLAVSFVSVQSIESRVTRNYTDHVRAKLVAQSGVEMAVQGLSQAASIGWHSSWTGPGPADAAWKYFGDEPDESREYALQSSPAESAKLRVPLERARNPSFAVELDSNPSDADPTPRSLRVDGVSIGLSGVVGGTYLRHGDVYSLKVLDCQSQINVNDGAKWGNRHSVSQNLRRLLNVLGGLPEVAVAWLGNRILDARPPMGYAGKMELRRAIGDDAAFARVVDFLTVHSFGNPHVVNPVPLSEAEYRPDVYPVHPANPNLPGDGYFRPSDAGGRPIFRYGHGRDVWGTPIDRPARPWPLLFWGSRNPTPDELRYSRPASFYNAVWTRDALNPQWIETVERSPVNVNHAARPVLIALVSDLQGFFEMAARRPAPATIYYPWMYHAYDYSPEGGDLTDLVKRGSETGFLYRTVPFASPGATVGADALSASTVVEEILACRSRKPSPNIPSCDYASSPVGGPFRSFEHLHRFVDHLLEAGIIVDRRPIFRDFMPVIDRSIDRTVFDANQWAWRLADVTLVDSPAQRRLASQAAADVLKANFNPNLHLNELNPDRNMRLEVDKTDLIVHSTEFCFVPMGRFEVASIGRILRNPALARGTTPAAELDAFTAAETETVSTCRIEAVVELYAPVHETAQAQFYRGEFGERRTAVPTNNNRSTESGPEPDNGAPPMECEYDGYVALPTIGGCFDDPSWSKTRGELRTGYPQGGLYANAVPTPSGTRSEGYGADAHSHFTYDHCAHFHAGGPDRCKPIGRWPNLVERASLNLPDKTETAPGPYSPVDSAGRHRLARSFALPTRGGNTRTAGPAAYAFSPSDLRLDGAYAEMGSAFGYDISSQPFSTSLVAAFWIKVNWRPETAGKIRAWLSLSNTNEFFRLPVTARDYSGFGWPPQYEYLELFPRPLPFGVYFLPGCDPSAEDGFRTSYGTTGRVCSLIWAMAVDEASLDYGSYAGGIGLISPTLNHEFEPRYSSAAREDFDRFTGQADGGSNHLRAHEWVHVAVAAGAGGGNHRHGGSSSERTALSYTWVPKRLSMFLNGRELPNTDQLTVHQRHDIWSTLDFSMQGKSIRLGGEYTEFGAQQWATRRITQPGTLQYCDDENHGVWSILSGCRAETHGTYRQYYADATIDEFYYWRDNPAALGSAVSIFRRGRYYRPLDSSPNRADGDGVFTSQAIVVPRARALPAGDSIAPPPRDSGDTAAAPAPPPAEALYLKGIAWTAMAEDVEPIQDSSGVRRLRPVVRDYRNLPLGGPPLIMSPDPGPDANGFSYETVAQIFVVVEGPSGKRVYGPYHNEGFSGIRDPGSGDPARLDPADVVRYVVKLRPGSSAGINTLLLATPVLEDVTLFFERGHARYVSFAEERAP
jgi:hypothetical protein